MPWQSVTLISRKRKLSPQSGDAETDSHSRYRSFGMTRKLIKQEKYHAI